LRPGLIAWLLISGLNIASAASAQGVDRAAIVGRVTDASGGAVPRAVVAASSPELIGSRRAVTDLTGTYRFTGLVPGTDRKSVV